MIIYALYDGEYIVAEGSVREIAMQTGIPENTVRWYGTQPARDRNINKALVKIEEDDVMLVVSNIPRAKRSFEGMAPIPSNDSYETAESVKTIFKHSQSAEWKPEPYTRMLFDACFKNWKE